MSVREELAALGANVKSLNDRFDRFMNLMNGRIEKWDDATTKVNVMMEERSSMLSPRKVSWFSAIVALLAGLLELFKK